MPKKSTRKEGRVDLFGEVFFSANSSGECDILGAALNVSDSGAAICSYRKLKEGTVLRIKGIGIWDDVKKGTVRWSQKTEDGIYRTGLSFLE